MRILFLKVGSFSHINDSVHAQLVKNYPSFQIETSVKS